ncbi:MAG: AtpZ/AtpI family protein [Acidobacteria bacterium]|nr:AtpZ/AtpI family protein [Acidobacteriota bacterium]
MIKSLLDADEQIEDQNTKPDELVNTSLTAPFQKPEPVDLPETESSGAEEVNADKEKVFGKVEPFEVSEPIGKPKISNDPDLRAGDVLTEGDLLELDPLPDGESLSGDSDRDQIDRSAADLPNEDEKIQVARKEFVPDTLEETVRKSGLASSAAIVLFASVAFMMFFGWFADFTFGTTPWGIVGGIILGAVIGFVQFFRTTAQILRPPKSEINTIPVYTSREEDPDE